MSFNNPNRRFLDPAPDLTGAKWSIGTQMPQNISHSAEPTPEPTPAPEPEPQPAAIPEPVAPATAQPEPQPAPEPAAVPEPASAPAATTWQDELKKVDKKVILKEVGGIDDYLMAAIEYYQETGDLTPYLEAKSVDFNKLDDQQILKHDLRKTYSGLSDEDFELIYQEEVEDKYKLDRTDYPAESPAAKTGLIRLKVDADRIRQTNIQKQATFKAPERTVDPAIAQQAQQKQLEIQNYQGSVQSSEVTKSLIQNKKVVLGEGESAYSFEIKDVQPLVEAALSNREAMDYFRTNPAALEDYYATVNYAKNRKAVEAGLIEHGKNLRKVEELAERANATDPPATPGAPVIDISPAAALAKYGKMGKTGG